MSRDSLSKHNLVDAHALHADFDVEGQVQRAGANHIDVRGDAEPERQKLRMRCACDATTTAGVLASALQLIVGSP